MKQVLSILFFLINFVSLSSLASPVTTKHAMVVTEQYLATQVGVSILKAGGNAVDAAVAVGYALAVVNPCCGNLGGGGFMTIHLAKGKDIFLNFRERAPFAATPTMFLDATGHVIADKSTIGYAAAAVPGTVLGLDTALKKYGTMTRQQVMLPAIHLAEHGYILTAGDIKILDPQTKYFKLYPNVAKIFLRSNKPYKVGDRLVQIDLANTLKQISRLGPAVFYRGQIAKEVVDASQAHGGIFTLKDFSDYFVQEYTPIYCTYRGYQIISAAPPSSGGITLCEMLNILENYPLRTFKFHSAKSAHYIIEAMRYAFFDRNNLLGDPNFVSNPVDQLISKDYAANIVRNILDTQATPSIDLEKSKINHEGTNTTHYSIIDSWGNAVSTTVTLNSFFGAKVIAGHTGFFLNDEMDDFTSQSGTANKFGLIQGEKNNIQPGKRPLSAMTPTIITRDNKLVMVVGSPGGPRIITSTLQTILNVLDYHMNIQDAVDAPRFHHQWLPDVVIVEEPQVFSDETTKELQTMGYHFVTQPKWSAVEAIYIDPMTHLLQGGSDNRRLAGMAAGY